MSKKTPKLRFKEFSDDWEQRKLGNCFKERTERSSEGELIAVTINSGVVKASELNRHNNSSEDKSHYKVVKKMDIAYNTMRMWQGSSGVSKYDGILSPAYTVAIPNSEIDSVFFSYMFKRLDLIHEFKINSQGLTSDTWNLKFPMFSNIRVNVPTYEEQKKIGQFFTNFDNLITLHQRKLEKLSGLKKAYLEKMFPKKGTLYPELRFSGFTDAWEQRKLGNCFKERTERSSEGELIAVTINSGVVKASELNRHNNSSEDKSHYKVVKKMDIAYNTMRMWQGSSGVSKYDGILSPAYTVAIPNSEIDSVFFSYMFKRLDLIHEFKINSQGLTSDTWNLKFPMFSNIRVNVPTYEEQKKIGQFFTNFDNLITLHQRKLDKLKQIKSGYLNSMFI